MHQLPAIYEWREQGRKAKQPSSGAAHRVPIRYKPEDRDGAGPDYPADLLATADDVTE
jgi:hypothetical protein